MAFLGKETSICSTWVFGAFHQQVTCLCCEKCFVDVDVQHNEPLLTDAIPSSLILRAWLRVDAARHAMV